MSNQKINRVTMIICIPLTCILLVAIIINFHIYCIYGLAMVTIYMVGTALFFRIDHIGRIYKREKV